MGKGGAYFKPRYIKVFGNSVHIDDYPTLIGASDANIQFTSWNIGDNQGEIIIGKYSLITPGVRIMAAEKIEILLSLFTHTPLILKLHTLLHAICVPNY